MIEFVTSWWLESLDQAAVCLFIELLIPIYCVLSSCSIHWVLSSCCIHWVRMGNELSESVMHWVRAPFIEYWVRAAFIEYWVGGPFIEHEWAMSSVNLWFTEFEADLFVFVWFSWVFTSQERKKEEERMRRLGNLGQAAYSYMWLVEFVIDWLSSWSWCCDDLVI